MKKMLKDFLQTSVYAESKNGKMIKIGDEKSC